MSSTFTTCSYHPHRVALAVCECCRRPICIQDRRILKKGYISDAYHNYNHNYCKICYGTILNSETEDFIYFGLLAIAYFLLFGITLNTNLLLLVNSIFIPLLIISFAYAYNTYKTVSLAKNDASLLKVQAYEKTNPNTIPSFDYSKKDFEKALKKLPSPYEQKNESLQSITCFECGKRFNINDAFCNSCGYENQDELLEKYNILFV